MTIKAGQLYLAKEPGRYRQKMPAIVVQPYCDIKAVSPTKYVIEVLVVDLWPGMMGYHSTVTWSDMSVEMHGRACRIDDFEQEVIDGHLILMEDK